MPPQNWQPDPKQTQTVDDYWTVSMGPSLGHPLTFRHYDRRTGVMDEAERDAFTVPIPDAVKACRPPRKAVAAVLMPEGRRKDAKPYGIGLVFEGQGGYQPWTGLHAGSFRTYEEAGKEARFINEAILKLDGREADKIIASSMAADRPLRQLQEALERIRNEAAGADEDSMGNALTEIVAIATTALADIQV